MYKGSTLLAPPYPSHTDEPGLGVAATKETKMTLSTSGSRNKQQISPHLPESPLGLSHFVPLTPEGIGLSSRLEELRSESLSLSLETTGRDRQSRGGHDYLLLLGQSGGRAGLLPDTT